MLRLQWAHDAKQIANPSVAALYEDALVYETGTAITSAGALSAYSGAKTGRSPSDKRIVREESSEKEVWWGPVNKEMTPDVRCTHLSSVYALSQHPRRLFPSSKMHPSHSAPTPSVLADIVATAANPALFATAGFLGSLIPQLFSPFSPFCPALRHMMPLSRVLQSPFFSTSRKPAHSSRGLTRGELQVWRINRERAVDYLNTRNRIYVIDGFAGWDERYRINVRVVCARAYHALFMRNMLIRPTREQLSGFHPDYVIYNAGAFPANRFTTGMTSATSVAINFAEKEMVILGTEYAGEMKKGIFTVLFYEMPVKHNVLTLHSSANQGQNGDVTVFFGLSGTGKTTLSADHKRALIGDDEHCWSDKGVFNIEGGCYAKCIGLSAEKEPDIYNAIKFGSILENVVFDPVTRTVDYDDVTLTENTRW